MKMFEKKRKQNKNYTGSYMQITIFNCPNIIKKYIATNLYSYNMWLSIGSWTPLRCQLKYSCK